MKKIIFIITLLFVASTVFAKSYEVYKPDNYDVKNIANNNGNVLFILDFSKSMTEKINGTAKVDIMKKTLSEILPKVNKNIKLGLRVYGNKYGITTNSACRSSSLLVPINQQSSFDIEQKLAQISPRGMTPITYSLKKAVSSDFASIEGQKQIVLLTDGGEDCDESPCAWAMDLVKKRNDVKVDVIAFNVNNPDDMAQLQCTASVTNGNLYHAKTAAELVNSFSKSLDIKRVEGKIIPNP